MRMDHSSLTVQEIRSQRRRRRGRLLTTEERTASLRKRAIWRCSDPEEEGSLLIQRIPPQALTRILSARLRRLTPLHSTLPQMMPSRQLLPTGLSTSKFLRLKRLTAFLMLSGTVTTTAQVTKQSLSGGQTAMLNWRIWRALLGVTVLYVAFVQNMRR
uniref:Uncharacterized protein n=1 Tax=Cherry twisted leaf associated virus TaxID=1424279 RepID=V5LXA7_9VIRU|nr:hypothetical protein [Cherry twisted leaf associated virus]AHJ80296.1 hypothetical protein [Cherry twisted leaf associated virus]